MLTITPEEFAVKMRAEGFEVEEDAVLEDTHYLLVKHPDEEGIVIAVTVCENQVEEVERNVEDGPEFELGAHYPTLDSLTPAQQHHLYEIDFGKFFDEVDDIQEFDELLAIIKENIKVKTEL